MRTVAELAVVAMFENVGEDTLEGILGIPKPNRTNSGSVDEHSPAFDEQQISRDGGVAALCITTPDFGGLLDLRLKQRIDERTFARS